MFEKFHDFHRIILLTRFFPSNFCLYSNKSFIRTSSSLLENQNRAFVKNRPSNRIKMRSSKHQKADFLEIGQRNYCQQDLGYESAIQALNSLQSNASIIEEIRKKRKHQISSNIKDTEIFLDKVGISIEQLNALSVIHVSGTKGKGSTCAFLESLLRESGYKTGLYSSPHLVAARERIRINGRPISKEEFTAGFWDVYTSLNNKKKDATDMPAYFKFLTVLSLKFFLQEEVDVAILEVGIGGEYDCTNVVRNPVVCGITSLDLDHTSILGDTIESIAWHKAGIMKKDAPVFTVRQQPPNGMKVLKERALEKQIPLFVVPPLETYGWGGCAMQLGLHGTVQLLNASLALQLKQFWVERTTTNACQPFELSKEDIFALETVVWPGRSQVLIDRSIAYFLDGAHTLLSMQSCVNWFMKASVNHRSKRESTFSILVFNMTGDRDFESIIKYLIPCHFDLAIFVTNNVSIGMESSSDQRNFTISDSKQLVKIENNKKIWVNLCKNYISNESEFQEEELSFEDDKENNILSTIYPSDDESCVSIHSIKMDVDNLDGKFKASLDSNLKTETLAITFPCIFDVIKWISKGRREFNGPLSGVPLFEPPEQMLRADNVQVLVTGSLHLVGGFLAVLDPTLAQSSPYPTSASVSDIMKRHNAQCVTPVST